MSNNGDYVERTTVTDTPDGVRREEYRTTAPVEVRSSNAGWWIAALVAIVAVVGLVFLFSSQNRQDQLQAAHDQGAAQASLDAATVNAQRAATQASSAAQTAVDSTARASQRAAQAAQSAANQTAAQTSQATQSAAASVGDAASDASDTAPSAPQQ
ncbi:MAG: hypothetical protein JWQ97_1021 [Phenylobacterium sp.]|nr:hypothetical protein [Phenylobacterium sp.]